MSGRYDRSTYHATTADAPAVTTARPCLFCLDPGNTTSNSSRFRFPSSSAVTAAPLCLLCDDLPRLLPMCFAAALLPCVRHQLRLNVLGFSDASSLT